MRWRPLIRGDLARRAQAAVVRLLANPRGRDASLGSGDAGIALALAELAAVRGDDRAARAARICMDRATAAMARDAMTPWLFTGFSGIAWAARRAFGQGSVEIDAAIARVARHASVPHDLLGGLVGLGVYALDRPRAGLGGVMQALARAAVRDADGIAWETAVASLPRGALPRGTRRHLNLGIAHGTPGVVGFLALAHGARLSSIAEAAASMMLDGAVRWLLARRLPDGAASCFPGWFDPGVAPLPSRQGWCYGDAAIARVLWLAASAVDEPAWRRTALEVARRAALRPLPRGGAIDGGLCHGAAGLAHIFNRHWQATGERVFADAAQRWFGRALARIDRLRGGGLLSGRAGVALALLHAISAREPTWDRMLLLS